MIYLLYSKEISIMFVQKVIWVWVFSLSLTMANVTRAEHTWVKGKLQAIYNSAYNVQNLQVNVQYNLQISKLKSRRLDMSKLTVQKWQVLVGKDVEIKVSKANELAVASDRKRGYVVLDIRYNPSAKKRTKLAQALAQPDAKKPWLNLLCKFADIATEPHPSSFYQTMFGNTYPYLEHYWKDTTYGLIDISGTQTIDWVTLPHNLAYYKPAGEEDANKALIREDCIVAAGGAGILDGYYGLNLFVNGEMFDEWAGVGGGGTTWIDLGAESYLGVIAHEMGHVYGLPHSSGRYGSNYDSPWDVMSSAYGGNNFGSYGAIPQHTIAFHKQKLGAININAQWSNAEVDASGGELIHLSRLEEDAVAGDYLIANISSSDGTKHYTVEARDKIGYDTSLPAKAVIIHEIEGEFRAYVVDPDNNGNLSDAGARWQVGETFTDAVNTISVEIVSSTATGYYIRITAPRTKPSKVVNVTATDNLLEKVRISWSPSQGAEYYKVLRYDSYDINSTHQTFTTANSNAYYDDVPDNANYHYYRVQACNSAGCSSPGQYQYAGGNRARVSNVEASDDQINNIHISWDTLAGATYYKVIRYDDYQATTNRQEFTTSNAYYDDDIQSTESSYYYYKVQACNSNGCSPASYSRSGREITVSNIEASDDLFDKIHITWDAISGATYYKVRRYEAWALDSIFVEFNTGNSDTSYDDVPSDASTYYYRVQACNSGGCSSLGNIYSSGKREVLNISQQSSTVTRGEFKYYTVDAFYGEQISALIRNLSADIDLYVKIGAEPTTNSYDCHSNAGSTSQEECSVILNSDEKVYIGVYGFEEGSFTLDIGAIGQLKDTDSDGIINHLDEDDDNDGISDALEIANGLDPLNASDAEADFDNDGFTNAIEISIGTDIRNANSKPIWAPIIMGDIVIFIPSAI